MTKEEKDCPQELIKLADSPFERLVAIEFVKFDNSLKEVKNEMRWLKRICFGVLLAVALNIILGLV